MSPDQIPCRRPFSECPTTGQFFARHTILPELFWEQHLGDPCQVSSVYLGRRPVWGLVHLCRRVAITPAFMQPGAKYAGSYTRDQVPARPLGAL